MGEGKSRPSSPVLALFFVSLALMLALTSCGSGGATTASNSVEPALLGASPNSLNFGTVTVGNSQNLNVTLSNTGTGSVSVSAANVTGTGYSVATAFPITIAAGATRTVPVTFTPELTGPANGTVAFVSNASNSPSTVTMTGAGQASAQHSVDLSWTDSTSIVVGYNVYRGTISGGPYTLLNGTLLAGTTYTDSAVLSSNTYYYVVRSMNAAGMESINSPQASAYIP